MRISIFKNQPVVFWVCLAMLFSMLILRGIADTQYPHTEYFTYETGDVAERYDGALGAEVVSIPVNIPDNPQWVAAIRSGVSNIVMLFLIIYVLGQSLEHSK